MESNLDRHERLQMEFDSSPGTEYKRALSLHRATLHVFERNASELISSLRGFESSLSFSNDAEREADHLRHLEILRHLQNFVSSATALVAVSRNWKNDVILRYTSFDSVYRERLSADFLTCRDSQFIDGLRNYMLHREMISSSSRGTVTAWTLRPDCSKEPGSGQVEWAFILNPKSLLQWDRWPPAAKDLLELQAAIDDHELELLPIIERYVRKVADFQAWLCLRLEELYTSDITQSLELYKRLNESPSHNERTAV